MGKLIALFRRSVSRIKITPAGHGLLREDRQHIASQGSLDEAPDLCRYSLNTRKSFALNARYGAPRSCVRVLT